MFCNKCGNQIADNGKFCNRCGAEIQPVSANVNSTTPSLADAGEAPTMSPQASASFVHKAPPYPSNPTYFETPPAIKAVQVDKSTSLGGLLLVFIILSAISIAANLYDIIFLVPYIRLCFNYSAFSGMAQVTIFILYIIATVACIYAMLLIVKRSYKFYDILVLSCLASAVSHVINIIFYLSLGIAVWDYLVLLIISATYLLLFTMYFSKSKRCAVYFNGEKPITRSYMFSSLLKKLPASITG